MEPEMEKCVDECMACYKMCEMTKTQCLETGGKHTDPQHLTLMGSCAKICLTAADFMLHKSAHHPHICAECAEICTQCAKDCDSFPEQFMKECASQCKACADSCERMAA